MFSGKLADVVLGYDSVNEYKVSFCSFFLVLFQHSVIHDIITLCPKAITLLDQKKVKNSFRLFVMMDPHPHWTFVIQTLISSFFTLIFRII